MRIFHLKTRIIAFIIIFVLVASTGAVGLATNGSPEDNPARSAVEEPGGLPGEGAGAANGEPSAASPAQSFETPVDQSPAQSLETPADQPYEASTDQSSAQSLESPADQSSAQSLEAPADQSPEASPAQPPAPQNLFPDLSASYADLSQEEKAEILNRLGVLLGDPERGLMLDIKVRRSDAAVFFTRLLGREQFVKDRSETDFAESRFPDAPAGMWYTPYISFCTNIGIIAGRTDGYYYPDDNISEKEFANVLLKILGYEYEIDYNWDTVYMFAYDIGLFDDPAYENRVEDNREYYRRDVCDQVFAVLSLEKKNSPKLLIEELIETGAISERIAADLDFDLSGLSNPGSYENVVADYPDVDADIYNIYHMEPDLLWVIFTKPVTFRDESIEICQTYDYSKMLSARAEEKTERDMLLRTGGQQPNMDYTLDIGNVFESNGVNAGMLSFDFTGYDESAPKDTAAGLTSLVRDAANLPGAFAGSLSGSGAGTGGGAASGGGAENAAGAGPEAAGDVESEYEPDDVEPEDWDDRPAGSGLTGGVQSGAAAQRPAGNASSTVEYFRIINAYTTASNEMLVIFSQPISETALNSSFYNIEQGNSILCSGSAGQITAQLVEGTVNSLRLTASGFSFTRGEQYRVTVSGRLTSSYTARLNEGGEDSYLFTADVVEERSRSFILHSIEAPSAYAIDLEFTQPLNGSVARQSYNYIVSDTNGRRLDISSIVIYNAPPGSSGALSSGASSSVDGRYMRVTVLQPLLINQVFIFTIIYMQNADKTADIANQTYQLQYKGLKDTPKKSSIAITGASSNNASCVEIYFSQKLDPVSAVIASNYIITGLYNGKNYNANPVLATYDPVLTPYMVRLFMQPDRCFAKNYPYTLRINQTIRDENKLSPERSLEIQFYANNREPEAPALKDAVIVGDGIVKLEFYKDVKFDPTKISEGNYGLIDITISDAGQPSGVNADSRISPILVKYINATTLILRFESIDLARKYRVWFNSMTDVTGLYSTRYPEQGASFVLRNGKR